jgi:23S rRNA maturation-related 3'-5' exoribonuclease YhaM
LNQFQAKESTEIPEEVYLKIKAELKKQRIENTIKRMSFSKAREVIKDILKKIREQSYYEHIPYIISKITGQPPNILSRETEEKVKQMFKQVQEPFNKYCPADRLNFLNYSYILNKIFKILGMDEYAKCFKLLKSLDKLRLQDSIWKLICAELGWKFHASI